MVVKEPPPKEATITVNPLIESTVRALDNLTPRSQELVSILVKQLAMNEGVHITIDPGQALKTPVEGVPLWISKLKQEMYSKRTIDLYMQTIKGYLERDPTPTKLSIQQWLAERLEQVSTARASNDRKALRSLFSFLYAEGLWPSDPTAKLKHIRVRYSARECPEAEDVYKLLQYQCFREKDTQKFRTMLVLLTTTGLRVSEGAGLKRPSINFKTNEITVIGKGGKEGVVPMLPMTTAYLMRYMRDNDTDSPFLFPGGTEEGYWSISSFEKTLRRACDKIGVKRMTPHQLRHFYATVMLRAGAKLEVVSKILRHASVGITADIYRHVMTDEMHEEAGKFAPLTQGPPALTEGRGGEETVEGEFKEVIELATQCMKCEKAIGQENFNLNQGLCQKCYEADALKGATE